MKTFDLAIKLIQKSIFLPGDGMIAAIVAVLFSAVLGGVWWRLSRFGGGTWHPLAVGNLVFLVAIGGLVAGVSGYWLTHEWHWLNATYDLYNRAAKNPATTTHALMIADSVQNSHRMNCIAEAIGVLFGILIAAIGIHGLSCPARLPAAPGKDEGTAEALPEISPSAVGR